MYTIAKQFAFSASHVIGGLPVEHSCARLHGHNYEVEMVLQSATLDSIGFIRDYHELSTLKEHVDKNLNHRHLNEVLRHHQTTSEIIAKWIYD